MSRIWSTASSPQPLPARNGDGAEANNGGAIDGSVPGDTDGAEANNGGAIDDSVPGDTDGADTEPTAEPDQIDDAAASSKVIAVG